LTAHAQKYFQFQKISVLEIYVGVTSFIVNSSDILIFQERGKNILPLSP
jgi:hypothetical protein